MAFDQSTTRPGRALRIGRRLNRPRQAVKRPFCSPAEGYNDYRILPPRDATDPCYIKVPHHFSIGPLGRGLVCGDYRKTHCHPGDRRRQLRQSASWKDREAAERLRPVARIFFNVLDLKRPDQGVQVLGVSQALFIDIINGLGDLTLEDVTHPTEGRTIRIRKVVEDSTIRYPEVQVSPRSNPIAYPFWRAELTPLTDYFVVLPYRQQALVFEGRLDPQKVTGFTFTS